MQSILLLALFIILIILIIFLKVPGEKSGEINIKLRISYLVPFMMGIRLLLAGVVQVIKPSYTAKLINVPNNCSFVIRELGFTNIVLGALGIGQYFIKDTKSRALISGGLALFISQATVQHMLLGEDLSNAIPDLIQSVLLITSTGITISLSLNEK